MFGNRIGPKNSFFFIFGLLALLLYQNCDSGYRTLTEDDGGVFSSGSLSPDPDPGQPDQQEPDAHVTYKYVNSIEWQPLELTFKTKSGDPVYISNMPAGAQYNSTTGAFLWLPQVGQAGLHNLILRNADGDDVFNVSLNVQPLDPSTIAKGPYDGTQDGDVGYVFIHGMSGSDYCTNTSELDFAWGGTPTAVSRLPSVTTKACYNGSQKTEVIAPQVAQQILNANCGRFQKCIIVTHSMGGLIIEHILTHAREALATDSEPALFSKSALYAQVKARTLAVVSVASAAGGVLAATIMESNNQTDAQKVVTLLADLINFKSDSSKSMHIARAAVLVPINENPGVPIFMVPGYTKQTTGQAGLTTLQLFVGTIPATVYNANRALAALDPLIKANTNSDGLVEMRSSCGVASSSQTEGPGYSASLSSHLSYCYSAPKKPNHYVWFLNNVNHRGIGMSNGGTTCQGTANSCEILEPNASLGTFTANASLKGFGAVNVIRKKLDANRLTAAQPIVFEITED